MRKMGNWLYALFGIGRTSLDDARNHFRDMVLNSPFTLLKRSDQFDPRSQKHALVIAVAPWSHPDIECLEKVLHGKNIANGFAFDIDECLTIEDLVRWMPGLGHFGKTPIIIEYRDGYPIHQWVGFSEAKLFLSGVEVPQNGKPENAHVPPKDPAP